MIELETMKSDDEQSKVERKRCEEKETIKCHSSEKYTSEESMVALKDNIVPASLKNTRSSIRNPLTRLLKKDDMKKEFKVLVYDTEGGNTTRSFIWALKQHLADFQFQDFSKAIEEERDTLTIIAVVRHTSIRIKEHLKDVKLQLDQDNVKKLENVIVTYFHVNGIEDGMLKKIQNISEEIQFAGIVLLDFSNLHLESSGVLDTFNPSVNHRKSINDKALKMIKQKIKKKWSADVYIVSKSPIANRFFEELEQDISKSIRLKKTFVELGYGNSPILIFSSENGFPKGLEENDPRKIFLVNIIDIATSSEVHDEASDVTENLSTVPDLQTNSPALSAGAERGNKIAPLVQNISMPCQHYGKIWEVFHYNGKFLEERNFIESLKRFVRTCPT